MSGGWEVEAGRVGMRMAWAGTLSKVRKSPEHISTAFGVRIKLH